MACCLRSHRLHLATWCWWLAALCLLKLAVPLMAVAAAHHRGVELVEVCSVYGMRTIALTPSGADGTAALEHGDLSADPAQHTSNTAHDHCALGGMLGGAMLLLAVLGWLLPGRARPDPAPPVPRPTRRPDPLLRWLGARLHAPPLPA